MTRKALALPVIVLALSVLACRTGADQQTRKKIYGDLYPTAAKTSEATVTPVVVVVSTTPLPTEPTGTPIIRVYTTTPVPTKTDWLCVTAVEAVYLRPSPSVENYPITQLENGAKVMNLGGRDGSWVFVQSGNKRGWTQSKYVGVCK